MENRNMSDERWIDGRLRALDPPGSWSPNAHAALARLHRRDRLRRSWVGAVAVASVACVVLVALPARATCALAERGVPPAEGYSDCGRARRRDGAGDAACDRTRPCKAGRRSTSSPEPAAARGHRHEL